MIQLFVLNLALAFVIGFIGRKRRLGFWGHFFASILFTPIIGILLVVASRSPKREKRKH
jgi:hypothetical protein